MSRERVFRELLKQTYIKLCIRRGIPSSKLARLEHWREHLEDNLKPSTVYRIGSQAISYLNMEEPGWLPQKDQK